MDLILNTTFNNPNLPKVQFPGFKDTFSGTSGDTLAYTDDGKEWQYWGYSPWLITESGVASGFGKSNYATVDGLRSDGTLTTVVKKAASSSADKRAGLTFRFVDKNNYLYVCPNTSNVLTFYGRKDNSIFDSQSISGVTLVDGDTLSVIMSGPQIAIHVSGEEKATRTVTEFVDSTLHGYYAYSSCDTEWDSIEFTTA